MKKVLVSILLVILILSACNASKLSLSKIENVPQKIEAHFDSDLNLQLINDGSKGSYVVFYSNGEIEADIDPQDNIVNIVFNELNPQNDDVIRNVYYVTTGSKHDSINVIVNGQEMSIDNVTVI